MVLSTCIVKLFVHRLTKSIQFSSQCKCQLVPALILILDKQYPREAQEQSISEHWKNMTYFQPQPCSTKRQFNSLRNKFRITLTGQKQMRAKFSAANRDTSTELPLVRPVLITLRQRDRESAGLKRAKPQMGGRLEGGLSQVHTRHYPPAALETNLKRATEQQPFECHDRGQITTSRIIRPQNVHGF